MEAATLPRTARRVVHRARRRSPADWAREHSRAFWIVVGLTVLAAVLRFATLGVQSYHHDEVVTASRVLRPTPVEKAAPEIPVHSPSVRLSTSALSLFFVARTWKA